MPTRSELARLPGRAGPEWVLDARTAVDVDDRPVDVATAGLRPILALDDEGRILPAGIVHVLRPLDVRVHPVALAPSFGPRTIPAPVVRLVGHTRGAVTLVVKEGDAHLATRGEGAVRLDGCPAAGPARVIALDDGVAYVVGDELRVVGAMPFRVALPSRDAPVWGSTRAIVVAHGQGLRRVTRDGAAPVFIDHPYLDEGRVGAWGGRDGVSAVAVLHRESSSFHVGVCRVLHRVAGFGGGKHSPLPADVAVRATASGLFGIADGRATPLLVDDGPPRLDLAVVGVAGSEVRLLAIPTAGGAVRPLIVSTPSAALEAALEDGTVLVVRTADGIVSADLGAVLDDV